MGSIKMSNSFWASQMIFIGQVTDLVQSKHVTPIRNVATFFNLPIVRMDDFDVAFISTWGLYNIFDELTHGFKARL